MCKTAAHPDDVSAVRGEQPDLEAVHLTGIPGRTEPQQILVPQFGENPLQAPGQFRGTAHLEIVAPRPGGDVLQNRDPDVLLGSPSPGIELPGEADGVDRDPPTGQGAQHLLQRLLRAVVDAVGEQEDGLTVRRRAHQAGNLLDGPVERRLAVRLQPLHLVHQLAPLVGERDHRRHTGPGKSEQGRLVRVVQTVHQLPYGHPAVAQFLHQPHAAADIEHHRDTQRGIRISGEVADLSPFPLLPEVEVLLFQAAHHPSLAVQH